MDIIEAVESVRSYKAEIISGLDMAEALREIAAIRARKERAGRKHDELIDKLTSSRTVSKVYESIGPVQTSRNFAAAHEMIEECSDLTRSILKDGELLSEAIDLIEPAVGAIPDYDTKVIIENKYLYGWSDSEIEELFSEHKQGYARMLEQKYFQSLQAKGSVSAASY